MSGASLVSSIPQSPPPITTQTVAQVEPILQEGEPVSESTGGPQTNWEAIRPVGRAKSYKKGSLPILNRVAFSEPQSTESTSDPKPLTRKPSRGHQRNISASEPQLGVKQSALTGHTDIGTPKDGTNIPPSPVRRQSQRVSYAPSKRPSNESIAISRRESQFDGASFFGERDNGMVEKPTIHLYPRKSIVTSASLRDIASKVVATGGKVSEETFQGVSNGSLSRRVSMKVGTSGMSKTRSSWSVKSKSANVIAGVVSSRSFGSIRMLSEPQKLPEATESEPWEHEIDERGEERYADVDGSLMSLGQDVTYKLSVETKPELKPELKSELAIPVQEEQPRPVSTVGPIDDSYRDNPDYYEYLLLCQRHASSNFIQKIDSSEVVYGPQETVVKVIGPYVLGDQIGKGAFGKVKEGLCTDTLQRVAVKIINKKRLRKMQNGIENVLREIKLLRRMKHPNVITLIDVYCKVEDDEGNVGIFNWFSGIEDEPITWTYDDGTEADKKVQILKWFLIFEYCPCSLQTLLEQAEGAKVDVRLANKFFSQLIEGLEYLHSLGIIHRDIKPGNMLITPDGVVKLADFGVAEQFSMYEAGDLMSQAFAGTHQFLSPEIAEGASEFLGDKVDIWACGVTLYNMLTGKYPFEFDEDGNLLALYERIVAGVYPIPDDFDGNLKDLIQGMLTKDPRKRLNLKQIKKHPWTLSSISSGYKQLPILSYPISEAESPSTPTSPLRNNNNHHHSERVRAPKPPPHITPCETTMIPYLQELYAEEIEDEITENGYLSEMAGEVIPANEEEKGVVPSNEVLSHSQCLPCKPSKRHGRVSPQPDRKSSRKFGRRKAKGLKKFFSKLFHSHSSIDPDSATTSPTHDSKKDSNANESSKRSRSPSRSLLSPK